ncbi:hypothetical protein NSMM_490036 [Nitrosomonas mobilis]|uniref:Uncharacterized protein n=2 Tax=Nitrosomonas mobilis TaxID=51642 RepID=A0A1G5SGM5_9PROT|nr:hypothetical protein NSMM_490036 [Nitrosomonas mobilis]
MNQRKELEHLCRCIARPQLTMSVWRFKNALLDGTTHIVMSSLEFMQRLSSQAKAQHHSFPWRARAQREASF